MPRNKFIENSKAFQKKISGVLVVILQKLVVSSQKAVNSQKYSIIKLVRNIQLNDVQGLVFPRDGMQNIIFL